MPLWPATTKLLRDWLGQSYSADDSPVFANRNGKALTRSGVRQRLDRAMQRAASRCATLVGRRVSPHLIRHTTAMHMLQAGIDLAVISLFLGHEDPSTTHRYLENDLRMKETALAGLEEPSVPRGRYRASQCVLAFPDTL